MKRRHTEASLTELLLIYERLGQTDKVIEVKKRLAEYKAQHPKQTELQLGGSHEAKTI